MGQCSNQLSHTDQGEVYNFLKWILERGGGREKKGNIDLLFHFFMYSLVNSCMCPHQGSNLQHWHIETVL